eukprot:TRINITY_DN5117_c4_g1_i1.p1 TRINITY_DN5117_c4_g1~~TRINITY_DN5117_c4_g1_i1.p1  ORF type:complete len:528 (+),score=123.16 TRINITY_DN5117_c4_g1_i1:72-1586(+)
MTDVATPYVTPLKDSQRSESRAYSYSRVQGSPGGSKIGRYDYVTPPPATGRRRSRSKRRRSSRSRSRSRSKNKVANTQYLRIPDGSSTTIEDGTIREVMKAVYRVESTAGKGIEKDVTSLVRSKVSRGGLKISVNSDEMGIKHDPYKHEPKVLVITYTPVKGGVSTQLAKPVGDRSSGTQFMRVPEHSSVNLPPGTILNLVSAEYRLEGDGKIGLQKDVTSIVGSRMRYGGLSMTVDNATMGVSSDPHPQREKILVINYIPRPEPELVTLDIREGDWLEIPLQTIAQLRTADFQLPYHEEAGHGYAVDVLSAMRSMLVNGGVKGFRVTKTALGIDYDPFEHYGKILRLRYLPYRLPVRRDAARADVEGTLRDAERLLCKPYKCLDTCRTGNPKDRVMDIVLRILNEVQGGGGWGEGHLRQAENLLRSVTNEHEHTLTQRLLTLARSGYVSSAPEMFRQLESPQPPTQPEWKQSPHHLLASVPDPPLHPSAAYHVGNPLGRIQFP